MKQPQPNIFERKSVGGFLARTFAISWFTSIIFAICSGLAWIFTNDNLFKIEFFWFTAIAFSPFVITTAYGIIKWIITGEKSK